MCVAYNPHFTFRPSNQDHRNDNIGTRPGDAMKLEFKIINFDVTTTIKEYSETIFAHNRDGWKVYQEGIEQVWRTTLVRLSTEPLST